MRVVLIQYSDEAINVIVLNVWKSLSFLCQRVLTLFGR